MTTTGSLQQDSLAQERREIRFSSSSKSPLKQALPHSRQPARPAGIAGRRPPRRHADRRLGSRADSDAGPGRASTAALPAGPVSPGERRARRLLAWPGRARHTPDSHADSDAGGPLRSPRGRSWEHLTCRQCAPTAGARPRAALAGRVASSGLRGACEARVAARATARPAPRMHGRRPR
jgi:hypothetical protein